MAKRRAGSQIASLTPDQKKSRINPIYLSTDGVQHTVGKLSTRATTLLQIAFRSEVYSQSYGAPKLQESQLGRFQGVPGRKTIWMWALWRGAKYTIRGRVVASPKFGPWRVLCVCVARGSSQHEKCSNYALTTLCGFCAGLCE